MCVCVCAGGAGGGADDQRDVFGRLHALLRQRQRAAADLHPGHQGQHRDAPEAALPAPADTPGSGELAAASQHAALAGAAHALSAQVPQRL